MLNCSSEIKNTFKRRWDNLLTFGFIRQKIYPSLLVSKYNLFKNVSKNVNILIFDYYFERYIGCYKDDEVIHVRHAVVYHGASTNITIKYEPNTLIMSIKEQIEEAKGIPSEQIRLIYSGKELVELQDDKTLIFYNIKAGNTIIFVLKLTNDVNKKSNNGNKKNKFLIPMLNIDVNLHFDTNYFAENNVKTICDIRKHIALKYNIPIKKQIFYDKNGDIINDNEQWTNYMNTNNLLKLCYSISSISNNNLIILCLKYGEFHYKFIELNPINDKLYKIFMILKFDFFKIGLINSLLDDMIIYDTKIRNCIKLQIPYDEISESGGDILNVNNCCKTYIDDNVLEPNMINRVLVLQHNKQHIRNYYD